MSTARSVFTEAIEDHLALKKQNVALEAAMPLARYDVGDPLDRYPGGPNRAADAHSVVVAEDVDTFGAGDVVDADHTQLLVGPSPEQAMEAATALEPSFADRPFEPLTGMTPMLSLVEDIDEDEDIAGGFTPSTPAEPESSADVLRFPGGVGPREDASPAAEMSFDQGLQTQAFTVSDDAFVPAQSPSPEALGFDDDATAHDAPTGEQPVLVIDADEPLATSDWSEPAAPARSSRRTSKPRFFGLGRKKSSDREQADGWFTDGPRDFNWD